MTPHPDAPPADPSADPWPAPRRSFALPGVIAAMAAIGVLSGAYILRHAPWAPDRDGGGRCARAFDARLRTARGGTDADLVAVAEAALAAGCGRHALDALDFAGGSAGEPAAWLLARFYDPSVDDPVLRAAAAPDAALAADIYARWAARSPRMAAALAALCTAKPAPAAACGR